ncbi:MAG: hypothetical protein GC162_12750 [Planctomycetes bacterium]|nr:hypothetical protein [Planctomycetota bacterium]
MDFVRRWMTQIHARMLELTLSQKMLIITLAVVIPMLLWMMFQWAASPEMVPVLDQALDAPRQARITATLDGRGITYKLVGDRIFVPREKQLMVLATLQMQQALPDDTTQGFEKLVVDNQSWWKSSEQNRQVYNIAKQNVLAQVLRAYPWVRDATVIISPPQDTGFGATHQRPTAAVNLVLEGGAMDQKKVDAVAGLVSGAVAEMRPEDVNVIDAVAGRQWKVRPEGEVLPGDYLETINAQEKYVREKIGRALGYINNVIVAVNVEVDITQRKANTRSYDKDKSLTLPNHEKTQSTETSSTEGNGGEPGVRSNAGAANAGATIIASNGGSKSTSETTETESNTFAGETTEESVNPGGAPTRISATVNIPRSYFVMLFKQGKAADTPEPTDEALTPIVDAALQRIKKQVEPLVATAKAPGEVVVDMFPDGGAGFGGPGGTAAPAGFSSTLMATGSMKMISLGALALTAVGLMLLMVRKANQKPPVPTLQELAGLPPKVMTEDEFIGQADEADPAMTGVELDESEIRHRKLTEQVNDMVTANPSEVAALLGRWVNKTE